MNLSGHRRVALSNTRTFPSSVHIMDQFSKASMNLKFLVSVSISFITLALSYSSVLQSIRVSFSAFFHSQLIDKNYMFLLCNGILVLLVKNSGLVSSSSTYSNLDEDDIKKSNSDQHLAMSKLSETKALELGAGHDMDEHVEVQERYCEDGEKECCSIIEEVEEENCKEEEHGGELLSTDELNKRYEDFIRKMKQGIEIEGQQIMIS